MTIRLQLVYPHAATTAESLIDIFTAVTSVKHTTKVNKHSENNTSCLSQFFHYDSGVKALK